MTPRGEGRTGARKAPTSVPDRPHLLEWLKDPKNGAAYVEAVLDEGEPEGLKQALRNIAEAQGGIAAVAKRAGLSRETLDRTLSKSGNPQIMSLTRIPAPCDPARRRPAVFTPASRPPS